jgi:hypothetical protein
MALGGRTFSIRGPCRQQPPAAEPPIAGGVALCGGGAGRGGRAGAALRKTEEDMMANSPISNKEYDLVSVVYHCCQGIETGNKYASDASRAGDSEAEAFFKEVCDMNSRLAERGKQLLKDRV